jgi:murein DD-endopeptidase MepM/ murein hydrolase activator NlpD
MPRRSGRVAMALLLGILLLLSGPGSAARAAQLIHVVQPDDTLEGIARRYGLDAPALAARNDLAWPYTLEVGQTLLIASTSGAPRSPAPAAGLPEPASPPPAALVALPNPGGALQAVAWRYGDGAGRLVQWVNPLASLPPQARPALLIPVRAAAAVAPARQTCTPWPAAGEALVARVNTWAIGLPAFERRWSEVLGGLENAGVNTWNAEFRAAEPLARRSVVQEMIDWVLVEQWAAGTRTTVSAADLDSWLQARVQASGGSEPFSEWLAGTRQTWEGFRQRGCQELLREALAQRLVRGSPDPLVRDEVLRAWLAERRASSSIEIYAHVASAAAEGRAPAGAPAPFRERGAGP